MVMTLQSALVKSSGRTIKLVFTGTPTDTTTWPTFNGGLEVLVNGITRSSAVNISIGGNEWTVYVSVGTLDTDFILPTDVVTISAPDAAWSITSSGDATAAFSNITATNTSNRQTDKYDTFCARFDETPWRYLTTTRKIGLIAFDNVFGNIIPDHVDFSVNGGEFVTCNAMAWNSDNAHSVIAPNGVWEYFTSVDPSLYPDGTKITVTARVYPTTELTSYKELSINFWANSSGTCDSTIVYVSASGSDTLGDGSVSNPYRNVLKAIEHIHTLGVHGGQVEIQSPGSYPLTIGTESLYFKGMVRIYPAIGVNASDVVFISANPPSDVNLGCNRLHFEGNMTFDMENINRIDNSNAGGEGDYAGSILWHDQNSFVMSSSYSYSANDPRKSYRYINGFTNGPVSLDNNGVHCTGCSYDYPVYAFSHIQRR
jgi:hypothetical protein